MKKLLVLGAVLCAAAVSQAASVNWNSSAKIADSTGAVIGSADAYSSLMNGGSLVLVLLQEGSYSGAITELGGTASFVSKPAGRKGMVKGSYSFVYGDGTLKNGDVLGVMFKGADGKLSQLIYTADKSLVGDTLTVAGLEDDTFSINFNYAASGTFTVVPEPTSGLMLLLGLAGLALRRKQA